MTLKLQITITFAVNLSSIDVFKLEKFISRALEYNLIQIKHESTTINN